MKYTFNINEKANAIAVIAAYLRNEVSYEENLYYLHCVFNGDEVELRTSYSDADETFTVRGDVEDFMNDIGFNDWENWDWEILFTHPEYQEKFSDICNDFYAQVKEYAENA